MDAVDRQVSMRLACELRPFVREQPGRRVLAENEGHWNRWWSQVTTTSKERFALTSRRIAANAALSLWFGHRYVDDPRCSWLSGLLAQDDGGVDFRLLDVGIDRVLLIAGEWMAACHGDGGELYAASMSNVVRLAEHLERGNELPWTSEHVSRCAALIWPQCQEMFDPGWLTAALAMVDRVARHCKYQEGVRWPMLLSVIAFGVDPWRDAAYPELLTPLPSLLAMSPAEMSRAVARQATCL